MANKKLPSTPEQQAILEIDTAWEADHKASLTKAKTAWELGKVLNAQKEVIKGLGLSWLEWLPSHTKCSVSTAEVCMRINNAYAKPTDPDLLESMASVLEHIKEKKESQTSANLFGEAVFPEAPKAPKAKKKSLRVALKPEVRDALEAKYVANNPLAVGNEQAVLDCEVNRVLEMASKAVPEGCTRYEFVITDECAKLISDLLGVGEYHLKEIIALGLKVKAQQMAEASRQVARAMLTSPDEVPGIIDARMEATDDTD